VFLRQLYPELFVVRVHSATNIYRYDENITFVKTELLPLVEQFRDLSAEKWGQSLRCVSMGTFVRVFLLDGVRRTCLRDPHHTGSRPLALLMMEAFRYGTIVVFLIRVVVAGTEWRNRYRITISFADGSPARISAINASLRPYRPSFVHMWELKTFWHDVKVRLAEAEWARGWG
jgi:hypothetical protein